MLLPSISAVFLVSLSALQFAAAWRLNPQNLDLRSEHSPVRRLLPNGNEKLAHAVEEIRSAHISSSTSSSSTPSSSTSKHPVHVIASSSFYGTAPYGAVPSGAVPLGTGTGLPGIPQPPLVTVVSIGTGISTSSSISIDTGITTSSSSISSSSSSSSSSTAPPQTTSIQTTSTQPPPPPSPPPPPTQTTIPPGNPANPSTGSLGGGSSIPSNPSNVVVSLQCGEAWQASNGAVSWANYGAIMKSIKAVSIIQLRDKGPVKAVGEGEGEKCQAVACKEGSAVWWCNENDVEIDRMFSVLWGANYILEECYAFVNREDEKAMKGIQVAGQVFFAGGWSVIVKGGMCA